MREPYTEPYTLRERLAIKYDFTRYRIRRFANEGLPKKIAWMLPHDVALWAFVRVAAHSGKCPSELNYATMYNAWEGVVDAPTLDDLGESLASLLIEAQRLNEGEERCRELSLTITKIEEAIHWILARQRFQSLHQEVFVNGEKVP